MSRAENVPLESERGREETLSDVFQHVCMNTKTSFRTCPDLHAIHATNQSREDKRKKRKRGQGDKVSYVSLLVSLRRNLAFCPAFGET